MRTSEQDIKLELIKYFGNLSAAQEAYKWLKPQDPAGEAAPRPNRWLKPKVERTVAELQLGGAMPRKKRPYRRKNLAYWAKVDKNKNKKK